MENATGRGGQGHSSLARFDIGSGGQGMVMLDPDSMIVHKHFFSMDGNEAEELATWEYEYLARYQRVLNGEPHLTCPTPLGVEREDGVLLMSHCPGIRLDDVLAGPEPEIDDHLAHIASLISRATSLYIEEFGEPYFDLGHHNMLYEPQSATLSLIDFSTMGEIRRSYQPGHDPISFSLGNLFGTSVYHTVRPRTWNNRNYWRRVEWISVDALSRISKRHTVSLPVVRDIGFRAYDVWALYGKPARWLWYTTLGRVLFRHRLGEIIARVPDSSTQEDM